MSETQEDTRATHVPFAEIEPRWQAYWEEQKTFRAVDFSPKPKYYVLDMFPYPSGSGLHVGHPAGYTATDVMARFKWARGFNVLHPMGFDAFGLPAEQYALQTGTHPAETTARNIQTFRRQLKALGYAIDWDRELATTDPEYYRWTQWIFLKLYERGLAYQAELPVNWCPELGTVLANEEVIDGKSERGGYPVIRKPMRQWVLKITEYADRLLSDLEEVEWPEGTLAMQRNWIGRSTGANVLFAVPSVGERLEVYTTRPDTLFGATYMVLAPEHELVDRIATDAHREAVAAYVEAAAQKTDRERAENKEKSGVFTGGYALNPVNEELIPIWVADYVLAGYGTGAIMAVPAHDTRDLEFAEKFDIPIRVVVTNPDGEDVGFTGDGISVNSGGFSGLSTADCKAQITAWLDERGLGKAAVNYKLRDWLFSRQRYWGEPFPLVLREADGAPVPLPEDQLPVLLPEVADYHPNADGEPPLSNASPEWLNVTDPVDGSPARREVNTMPQWAGSCWYYLRFLDPHNAERAWDPAKEKYWMPVDLYVGGAEHAVLHLLYARFWHKVLYDAGYVTTLEPFDKLVHQGMILGEDNQKMSKSRGNVVNPDDVLAEHGADGFRVYMLFRGPLEEVKPWSVNALKGARRFLDRVWALFHRGVTDEPAPDSLRRKLHRTIKKVTEDTERMRFNTAVAAMMELYNEASRQDGPLSREVAEPFCLLLGPYAPHMAEELWERLGHAPSVAHASWPAWDEAQCKDDLLTYGVQVSGKLRGQFEAAVGTTPEALQEMALAIPNVQRHLEGRTIRKIVVVPGKLVSIVA